MPEQPPVGSTEAKLVARFAPGIAADIVRRTLAEVYAELRDRATVTTYLDILAERLATQRLAARTSRQPTTGTPTAGNGPTPGAPHD